MANQYILKSRHNITQLTYHLVLVIKYRKPCIDKKLGDYLIVHCKKLIEQKGGTLLEGNYDKDHLHILMGMPPNINMSNFVSSMKTTTSRLARDEFKEYLREYLWGDAFWSSSFYLGTTGGATIDVIQKYIEQQGKPKRKYIKRQN